VDAVINRYYDPTTDQFLSVDPKVSQTDQPYVFTNDSPLNATDPLGERIAGGNGESCISLSACSNPSVQARNQAIWSTAANAAFWAGVKAYEAMQAAAAAEAKNAVTNYQNASSCNGIEESVSHCDLVTYSSNRNGSTTESLTCGGNLMFLGGVSGVGGTTKGLVSQMGRLAVPGSPGAADSGAAAMSPAAEDGIFAAMADDPLMWIGFLGFALFELAGAVTAATNAC
jgi:hypothetical protein